jgi:hypothetical protein
VAEVSGATNRPTYAPERRPGDSRNDYAGAYVLAFHFDVGDVYTVAALIEAGAAALKYAPGNATDFVELNARRRTVKLGRAVAVALRAEHSRRTTPAPTPKRKAKP